MKKRKDWHYTAMAIAVTVASQIVAIILFKLINAFTIKL